MEFLIRNNITVLPPPPNMPDLAPDYFSLFPHLKIKLKGHHSDTTEVIKTESQAVLNTLTEHDFHDGTTRPGNYVYIVYLLLTYFRNNYQIILFNIILSHSHNQGFSATEDEIYE
jgi:hypothetical protein